MSKNHKIYLLTALIILLVLSVTVVSFFGFQRITQDAMMVDLFNQDSTCRLPCWNKIMPGITKSTEAVDMLQRITYISKGSIQIAGNEISGGCRWDWIISGERIGPSLFWQNEIVREISLGLSLYLTVGKVLDQFGPPDAIITTKAGTPENWYWIIDLIYPRSGLQMKAYTQTYSSQIEPTTEVGAIVLFSPDSIEGRIQKLYPEVSIEKALKLNKSWKGFGDLKKLYELNN